MRALRLGTSSLSPAIPVAVPVSVFSWAVLHFENVSFVSIVCEHLFSIVFSRMSTNKCATVKGFLDEGKNTYVFFFFSVRTSPQIAFSPKEQVMFDSRCQHEYMHRSQIETSVRADFFVFQQVFVDDTFVRDTLSGEEIVVCGGGGVLSYFLVFYGRSRERDEEERRERG